METLALENNRGVCYTAVKDGIKGEYWRAVLSIEAAEYADKIHAAIESGIAVDYSAFSSQMFKSSQRPIKVEKDPHIAAKRIIDLTQRRLFRLGPHLSLKESEGFAAKVESALNSDKPLEFVLIGSAFKIANPFKTGMGSSDIAELATLVRIKRFLDEVRDITNHPANFNFIWEGHLHQKSVGAESSHVERCWERMQEHLELIGDVRLIVHDYINLIMRQGYSLDIFDEYISENQSEKERSPRDTRHWASFLQTHNSPNNVKGLEEEIKWFQEMARARSSNSGISEEIARDYHRYGMINQILKQQEIVGRSFPDTTLRFTARPRSGAIGFSSSGNLSTLLPHHGVRTISGNKQRTRSMVESLTGRATAVVDQASKKIIAFTK